MIRVQAPTRIDLAGGTLDLLPLYQFVYPKIFSTINVAINIYNTVEITKLSNSKIIITSNYNEKYIEFENQDHLLTEIQQNQHSLMIAMKAVFYFGMEGVKVNINSEAPKGSGLGNSSSLLIAIIGGLNIAAETNYSREKLIEISQGIETSILKIPTGTQDYIAVMYGGINTIRHTLVKREINKVKDGPIFEKFLKRTVLCYVGEPKRFSSNNENPNWHIFRNVVEQKGETLENLIEINKVANTMEIAIESNDWQLFIECINEETRIRSNLSESIVSDEIEDLIRILNRNDSQGYKICGAGGGGCVLIFSENSEVLKNKLKSENYLILDFSLDNDGFQVISKN